MSFELVPDTNNLLDKANILKYLQLESVKPYQVFILPQVDSTNKYAMEHLPQFVTNTVITTEMQTNGCGRNGKIWNSLPHLDITASFIYKLPVVTDYCLFPLVIAVAVNRLFKQYQVMTKIKWPNDILLLNGTKISGILVESKKTINEIGIIVGIGIDNIYKWDRNKLLSYLIKHVDYIINEYQHFGFATIRQEWLDNCVHYGQMVKLYSGNKKLDSGIHCDLTHDGAIQIKHGDGTTKNYLGAHISLLQY